MQIMQRVIIRLDIYFQQLIAFYTHTRCYPPTHNDDDDEDNEDDDAGKARATAWLNQGGAPANECNAAK